MKKFIIAILAVLYLSTSIGATIHLHYCMDKMVAWNLGSEKENPNCPYCGMAKKSLADEHCGKESKGCCKDEHKLVKVEKDQKATENNFDFTKYSTQLTTNVSLVFDANYTPTYLEYPVSNSPPRASDIPLFVRNCVFRI